MTQRFPGDPAKSASWGGYAVIRKEPTTTPCEIFTEKAAQWGFQTRPKNLSTIFSSSSRRPVLRHSTPREAGFAAAFLPKNGVKPDLPIRRKTGSNNNEMQEECDSVFRKRLKKREAVHCWVYCEMHLAR